MVNELSCIQTCIAGQSPAVAYFNYGLIALIAISSVLLIFFRRRFSTKANLMLKTIFLSSVLALLAVMFFSSPMQDSIFYYAHQLMFLAALLFFVTSYVASPYLMKLGLTRVRDYRVEEILEEESRKTKIKMPELFIYHDIEAKVFTVSGLHKTLFISNAMVERLTKEELKAVIMHELMHLNTNYFNLKRILYATKAAFLGLLPLHLNELDDIEELHMNRKMPKFALALERAREKLN